MDTVTSGSKISPNVFSVDVEDWYQGIEIPLQKWEGFERRLDKGLYPLLDVLESAGVQGTFFTLGWVAEHHPEAVKEIARRGHELASHGYSHTKVYDLTPEAFREEVSVTKRRLEDLTGQPVTAYRAPFFTVTPKSLWALDILAETGHTTDCSINPVKTWRYGIANSPEHLYVVAENGLVEFPASRFEVLGKPWGIGGAFFRLLPYALTRRKLQARVESKGPFMFYIHPWEYDPSHPKAEMEWKARLTHYTRLGSTLPNTRKLLQQFRFTTLRDYLAQLDLTTLPRVSTSLLHT